MRLRQALSARRLLPPTLAILLVCSQLPPRWFAWVEWFGGLTRTLVAPVMNSAAALAHAVRPPAGVQPPSDLVARLLAERDKALFLQSQADQEIARLQRLIKDLQGGIELAPDPALRQVAAPVIGRDADAGRLLLHIRAGSAQGLVPGSVAVVDGVQLLGRIQSVGTKVSTVQCIADRAAGRIRGLVMAGGAGIECDLEPRAGGVLQGRLAAPEPRAGEQIPEAQIGHLVRLADATWPRNAQMLELGTVVAIEPNPDQPVRKIITVRPRLDLARAGEVVLRIAGESGAEGPAAAMVPEAPR